MTANVMKGAREIYLEAGTDGYIVKAINIEVVAYMVENGLHLKTLHMNWKSWFINVIILSLINLQNRKGIL